MIGFIQSKIKEGVLMNFHSMMKAQRSSEYLFDYWLAGFSTRE